MYTVTLTIDTLDATSPEDAARMFRAAIKEVPLVYDVTDGDGRECGVLLEPEGEDDNPFHPESSEGRAREDGDRSVDYSRDYSLTRPTY